MINVFLKTEYMVFHDVSYIYRLECYCGDLVFSDQPQVDVVHTVQLKFIMHAFHMIGDDRQRSQPI